MAISCLVLSKNNWNFEDLFSYYLSCRARLNKGDACNEIEKCSGELWTRPYGLDAAIRIFQNKYKSSPVRVAKVLTSNPDSLPKWILSADWSDFIKLKSYLKNYPKWGSDAYDYLLTCWCITRCEAQLVLNVRKDVPPGIDKIRLLRDHVKAVERLADSQDEPLFWVFDYEYPPARRREKIDFLHVHVYGSNRLLKAAQDFDALRPFRAKRTIHSAIRPVSRPVLVASGQVVWPVSKSPSNKSGYANTLAYAASKVVGLASTTSNRGLSSLRRSSRHAAVKRLFKNFKGGQYRHWGHRGFVPKQYNRAG